MSKTIDERVKEFERQNYLLSCLKGVHICSLENSEIKTAAVEPESSTRSSSKKQLPDQVDKTDPAKLEISTAAATDKEKRLRLAKAKAAALRLKLQLLEPLKNAA